VRLRAPSVTMPCHPGTVEGTRPRLALSPTRPQHEAGILIEPPRRWREPPEHAGGHGRPGSAARAARGVERFHGLRVIPNRLFSVTVIEPNSGVLVRPVKMNPAAARRSAMSSLVALGPAGAPWDP